MTDQELQQLVDFVSAHKWIPLAALCVALVVRLLKGDTPLPYLPAKYRPWLALGLGVVAGVLDKVAGGTAWLPAVAGGLVSGLLAIAAHDTVVESARGGREFLASPRTNQPKSETPPAKAA